METVKASKSCWIFTLSKGKARVFHLEAGQQFSTMNKVVEQYPHFYLADERARVADPSYTSALGDSEASTYESLESPEES